MQLRQRADIRHPHHPYGQCEGGSSGTGCGARRRVREEETQAMRGRERGAEMCMPHGPGLWAGQVPVEVWVGVRRPDLAVDAARALLEDPGRGSTVQRLKNLG